jgi:hypothetical protein
MATPADSTREMDEYYRNALLHLAKASMPENSVLPDPNYAQRMMPIATYVLFRSIERQEKLSVQLLSYTKGLLWATAILIVAAFLTLVATALALVATVISLFR